MASNRSERDLPIPLPSPLQSNPPDFSTYSQSNADPEPVSPISSVFPMSPVPTRPGQVAGQAAGLRMVSPSPAPTARTAVSSRPLPSLPPLDTSPEVTGQQEPSYITNTCHQVEQRIRYLPDWETPRNPPKRGKLQQTRNLLSSIPFFESRKQPSFVKKQHKPRSRSIPSLFSLVDPPAANEKEDALSPNDQHGVNSAGWRKSPGFGYGRNSFAGLDPERHGHGEGGGVLPTHTVTTLGSIPNPPPPPRLTEKERMKNLVNRRLLPPEKRYPFGLNRRRFCLFVLLPVLLLLLLALGLGLGLGLGLKNKDNDDDSDIPLPSPLGEDTLLTVHEAHFNYYSPSNRIGACGLDTNNDAVMVAISHKIWDEAAKRASDIPRDQLQNSNPNTNPLCGRMILLANQPDLQGDGGWVQARVVDRCGPDRCPEAEYMDLTVGAYEAVYNLGRGVYSNLNKEDDEGREGWWVWVA